MSLGFLIFLLILIFYILGKLEFRPVTNERPASYSEGKTFFYNFCIREISPKKPQTVLSVKVPSEHIFFYNYITIALTEVFYI